MRRDRPFAFGPNSQSSSRNRRKKGSNMLCLVTSNRVLRVLVFGAMYLSSLSLFYYTHDVDPVALPKQVKTAEDVMRVTVDSSPPPPLLVVSSQSLHHDRSTKAIPVPGLQHKCSIPHLSVQQSAIGIGSDDPLLLTGWDNDDKGAATNGLQQFLTHYGNSAFYIKDGNVQVRSAECVLSFAALWNFIAGGNSHDSDVQQKIRRDTLAFTNNLENPVLFDRLPNVTTPSALQHIDGFTVLSVLRAGQSHPFHKHGESWIGSSAGFKAWWFLPPSTKPVPKKVNACDYLTGKAQPPPGAFTCVQTPGTIIWFPKDWYHATCALSEWTVGIGRQQKPLIRQDFPPLPATAIEASDKKVQYLLTECVGYHNDDVEAKDWKWYDGDLNQYYNDLEKDHKRNPKDLSQYAVHRWMGEQRTTLIHYELIHSAIQRHQNKASRTTSFLVLDAGCGLGSALMWMEQKEPRWNLTGRTISEKQLQFIETQVPPHNFQVKLQSYDELDADEEVASTANFNAIYSIEALIHSPNITKTMTVWAQHLDAEGSIVIIDDFLSAGVDRSHPDVTLFCSSWLANSLVTVIEFHAIARQLGLELVESRDLLSEYRIVELNYRNKVPKINPHKNMRHQGWMGSKLRQKLTVEGKLGYNMLVFQKAGRSSKQASPDCSKVPSSSSKVKTIERIVPKDECISGWYCCGEGPAFKAHLDANRTVRSPGYLKLEPELFGDYMQVFASHLNSFYETLPSTYTGKFLDIGATGSTASGMKQVTTKFQHFAGPMEYWMLDSDVGAASLNQTIHCDVCECPEAPTCGFDVTFSHTVLEHAPYPEKTFDEIARVTKKGGLTMHLIPWSYQYHATPGDFYRFSHSALTLLLKDRGFEILELGYDICSKPDGKMNHIDEHFDQIWLSYVVGRKK